jgi:hypothetical protein
MLFWFYPLIFLIRLLAEKQENHRTKTRRKLEIVGSTITLLVILGFIGFIIFIIVILVMLFTGRIRIWG